MKKKLFFIIGLLILFTTIFISCNNDYFKKSYTRELQRVQEIQGFTTINGYKVQDGKFFFTGIKKNEWDFYSLDLKTKNIKSIHQEAENYDLYIALGETRAVYIDLEGNLFYKEEDNQKKIDEGVMGLHRPNLLLSPRQDAILYTKGPQGTADLYVYFFQQEKPLLIKENISIEAFNTFAFSTQWSNKNNYFIYNNEEIYNNEGKFHGKINATIAKWSPDDEYIIFIKKPYDLQDKEIIIGDWHTYIGEELSLLEVKTKKEEVIYNNPSGLIDPIDNIQWSKDASKVSISIGNIKRSSYKELESIDYNKIFVYDLLTKEALEVEKMPYNYYEILFNNYLYGSSLGKRDVLEIVEIHGNDRKRYENPVLLNSQDMFIISYGEEGYFLDNKSLIKINSKGKTKKIIELPWQVNEIYLDIETKNFIITNRDMEMYLLEL